MFFFWRRFFKPYNLPTGGEGEANYAGRSLVVIDIPAAARTCKRRDLAVTSILLISLLAR